MKTNILLNHIPIIIILCFSFSVKAQNTIIGTWISESDPKWVLVFSADEKCSQFYDGVLTETDQYRISNTSPQCGIAVPVDSSTSYLQLTDVKDGSAKCYEINGITDSNLSIRVVDRGGFFLFKRKNAVSKANNSSPSKERGKATKK